ncbi:hypothetical protein GGQ85_004429 [Nitrobacter vulgaris]|uniref:CBASS cGAMP-activated phospholipase n=1 Tax=Nitrobacter vulgaris TaxID=29421 RepID=UPI002857A599|nr:CBASS cGAMP-activated phospholipase [Nitrobacter vulgaris]MDR6306695.1 hypothetical protein [Nitrobacter vulgaris]
MFRILCLDGGGIKGVFTAAALARIENLTNKSIIDHFDLIAGTSTGGIVAIGLALGHSAQSLLSFYRDRGPRIFPSTGLLERSTALIRQLFVGPKHSQTILRQELSNVLGKRSFGESKCRLVIPAYDAVGGRIYVFKTAHAAGLVNDVKTAAIDVALATSAAPTYFAAARTDRDGRFVDGGVWANSTVMIALVEAAAVLRQPLSEINILSIGTTTEPFSIARNSRASALKWNIGLVDLMMEAQVEAAQAEASLLLDCRLHRVDFKADHGRFALDNANELAIADLARLGSNEIEKKRNIDLICDRFVNGASAKKFVPLMQTDAHASPTSQQRRAHSDGG